MRPAETIQGFHDPMWFVRFCAKRSRSEWDRSKRQRYLQTHLDKHNAFRHIASVSNDSLKPIDFRDITIGLTDRGHTKLVFPRPVESWVLDPEDVSVLSI